MLQKQYNNRNDSYIILTQLYSAFARKIPTRAVYSSREILILILKLSVDILSFQCCLSMSRAYQDCSIEPLCFIIKII